jgi:hypothetical protein
MPVVISDKRFLFFKTNNKIENMYWDFSGKISYMKSYFHVLLLFGQLFSAA